MADTQETKLDYSSLEVKLEELNAVDFQECERACRMSADPTPDIIYSGAFRARLAAKALGVPYQTIRTADLKTYTAIVARVLGFLLQNLGAEALKQKD